MVIYYNKYSHKLVNKITKGYSKPKDFKNYDGIKCSFGYCVTGGVDGKLESIYKTNDTEKEFCISTSKFCAIIKAINKEG